MGHLCPGSIHGSVQSNHCHSIQCPTSDTNASTTPTRASSYTTPPVSALSRFHDTAASPSSQLSASPPSGFPCASSLHHNGDQSPHRVHHLSDHPHRDRHHLDHSHLPWEG